MFDMLIEIALSRPNFLGNTAVTGSDVDMG
jgi:hypothetical protein